jgi:hypothetical protein
MARPYLGGSAAGVKSLSAAATLTMADSGKTIFVTEGAAAYDITLPAVSEKGCEFVFILTASPASNDIDIVSAAGDDIIGIEFADEDTAAATDSDWDKITFSTSAAAGSFIKMVSNGTNWFAHIFGQADGAFTQTD